MMVNTVVMVTRAVVDQFAVVSVINTLKTFATLEFVSLLTLDASVVSHAYLLRHHVSLTKYKKAAHQCAAFFCVYIKTRSVLRQTPLCYPLTNLERIILDTTSMINKNTTNPIAIRLQDNPFIKFINKVQMDVATYQSFMFWQYYFPI